MPVTRLTSMVVAVLWLAGCAFYPGGLSEEQWLALTPAERAELQMRQAEIDRIRAEERLALAEAQRLEAGAEAARQQALLAERRSNPQIGDRVVCLIEDAVVDFYPGWRPVVPFVVDLVRGEGRWITVRHDGERRTTRIWANFREEGDRVQLCRFEDSRCQRFNAGADQFFDGVDFTIDNRHIIRGAMSCVFPPDRTQRGIRNRRF